MNQFERPNFSHARIIVCVITPDYFIFVFAVTISKQAVINVLCQKHRQIAFHNVRIYRITVISQGVAVSVGVAVSAATGCKISLLVLITLERST